MKKTALLLTIAAGVIYSNPMMVMANELESIGATATNIVKTIIIIFLFVSFLFKAAKLRNAEDDPRLKIALRNSILFILMGIVIVMNIESIYNFLWNIFKEIGSSL